MTTNRYSSVIGYGFTPEAELQGKPAIIGAKPTQIIGVWKHYDTDESHLFESMTSDSLPMILRVTIARHLLRSLDGQLRSKAYWWLYKQHGWPITFRSVGQ